jgi:small subunit ribosomal protein S13
LEDTSKQNKQKSDEKTKEFVEDKPEDKSSMVKEQTKTSEKEASNEINTEEKRTIKTDEIKEKPKGEPQKEKTPKKEIKKDIKDDFKYIVRIANTDIDGDKTITQGLTSIKGIGMHMSTVIIDMTKLDRNLKMGNLNDKQIEKISEALEKITDTAPSWMLNHQKDVETGENIHLIGAEINMRLRDEINIMKKIRSYKGIRHERGLTVRGQRTRGNNRKGLALGVSKKRAQSGGGK